MSDPGNPNGTLLNDPVVNSAVVGVDMLSGDGNDPGNPPTTTTAAAEPAKKVKA